ncbi:MAG: hypothetical protein LKE96_11035 [Acetobacter peroxydans]|jgi:hypothetical protein|nr:hypothetical protein [Acetobacter peroxydans]
MIRSKNAIVVNLLSLALLVGCGDNRPSDSDIKKQLLSQLSPCPELSITNFKKINGYPQNDGSYIAEVQYNLVFTPSDQMLDYVNDYNNTITSITREGANDKAKAEAFNAQAKTIDGACVDTYKSNLSAANTSLASAYDDFKNAAKWRSISQLTLSNNPYLNAGELDQAIAQAKAAINDAQQLEQERLEQNKSNSKAAIAQGETWMDFSSNDAQIRADTNQQITADTNYINAVISIKDNFTKTLVQYSSCENNIQKLYQANQGIFDHLKALNTEQVSTRDKDIAGLQNSLNKDCPIIVIGGLLGLFDADRDDIDAYRKTYRLTESGSVHLIKSDNGWVIQN